eukprot:GHVT01104999.1.p1 GENE.GHVT01104999.1~~GHVT01104999.1.p1  ORF type:complete len:404 (-),score=26.49 GHVT01104999.1:185-1396(-)
MRLVFCFYVLLRCMYTRPRSLRLLQPLLLDRWRCLLASEDEDERGIIDQAPRKDKKKPKQEGKCDGTLRRPAQRTSVEDRHGGCRGVSEKGDIVGRNGRMCCNGEIKPDGAIQGESEVRAKEIYSIPQRICSVLLSFLRVKLSQISLAFNSDTHSPSAPFLSSHIKAFFQSFARRSSPPSSRRSYNARCSSHSRRESLISSRSVCWRRLFCGRGPGRCAPSSVGSASPSTFISSSSARWVLRSPGRFFCFRKHRFGVCWKGPGNTCINGWPVSHRPFVYSSASSIYRAPVASLLGQTYFSFCDRQAFMKMCGLPDARRPFALLLDEDGRVAWAVDGVGRPGTNPKKQLPPILSILNNKLPHSKILNKPQTYQTVTQTTTQAISSNQVVADTKNEKTAIAQSIF